MKCVAEWSRAQLVKARGREEGCWQLPLQYLWLKWSSSRYVVQQLCWCGNTTAVPSCCWFVVGAVGMGRLGPWPSQTTLKS